MTTTDLTTDPRLAESAACFARALEASRSHSELAALALARHGDHGPQISGCVRDHFPADTKTVLRILARQVTELCELAHAARPPRVRRATIVRLGRQIAARDGSGYYGPQPERR